MPRNKQISVNELLSQPNWNVERKRLRALLLECGLTEKVKWNKLCFTHNDANVAIFYGLKQKCGIGFFKGSLLKDKYDSLIQQTENSQAVRLLVFESIEEINQQVEIIKYYITQAIQIEQGGFSVDFKLKNELVFAEELANRMSLDRVFETAFLALTPGRQRGYNLHISAAKQAKTRIARIEKYYQKILEGKGMNDWK